MKNINGQKILITKYDKTISGVQRPHKKTGRYRKALRVGNLNKI